MRRRRYRRSGNYTVLIAVLAVSLIVLIALFIFRTGFPGLITATTA